MSGSPVHQSVYSIQKQLQNNCLDRWSISRCIVYIISYKTIAWITYPPISIYKQLQNNCLDYWLISCHLVLQNKTVYKVCTISCWKDVAFKPSDDILGWNMQWAIVKIGTVFTIKRLLCWLNYPIVILNYKNTTGRCL